MLLDSELSERRIGALTLESWLLIIFSSVCGRGSGCIPFRVALRSCDAKHVCKPSRRGGLADIMVVGSNKPNGCGFSGTAEIPVISLLGTGSGPFLRLRLRTSVTFLLFLQEAPCRRETLCAELMRSSGPTKPSEAASYLRYAPE